jgi:ribose transport system ATP-binding protein
MTLAALPSFTKGGVLQFARERKAAQDWIGRLKIKTPSPYTMIGSLSGGNQQKSVLSKWRIADVKVLILDHPTRGIDVGAKEDVYELIRDMTAEGLAIILLGDTLEEVIGLSNTILVMRDGAVTARLDAPQGGKPKQLQLLEHMV